MLSTTDLGTNISTKNQIRHKKHSLHYTKINRKNNKLVINFHEKVLDLEFELAKKISIENIINLAKCLKV
jgi:hypothetical protein